MKLLVNAVSKLKITHFVLPVMVIMCMVVMLSPDSDSSSATNQLTSFSLTKQQTHPYLSTFSEANEWFATGFGQTLNGRNAGIAAKSPSYHPTRMVIKLSPGISKLELDEMVRSAGQQGVIVQTADQLDLAVVELQDESKLQAGIKWLSAQSAVEFVEPDYTTRAAYIPNDKQFDQQWHHSVIRTPLAWDLTRGAADLVVAVLDTGLDANHAEFSGKTVPGYNFIDSNEDTSDDNGHGTHVAGLVAAATDNRQGTAAVCPDCKVMPLKVLDEQSSGTLFDVVKAITHATDKGAKIINMSLTSDVCSNSLQEAIDYAWNRGVLLVAAAGNFNSDKPIYPAACKRVISVGAIDEEKSRARYSNYGETIDFVAPGTDVYSTFLNGEYTRISGTSMATPIVSGIAALVWSRSPQSTNSELEKQLQQAVQDLGDAGFDNTFGYGLLDAAKAVGVVEKPLRKTVEPNYTHTIQLDGALDFYGSGLPDKNETFRTSTAGYSSHITWDNQYLYLGYSGADLRTDSGNADRRWLVAYIGERNGAVKYQIRLRLDGKVFQRLQWSGAWQVVDQYPQNDWGISANQLELRVPLSDVAWMHNVQIATFLQDDRAASVSVSAVSPSDATIDVIKPGMSAFHEFDLSSELASASQVYNYELRVKSEFGSTVELTFKPPRSEDVKILQSSDGGLNWYDARLAGRMMPTSTSMIVFNLVPDETYKFQMVVSNGPSAGRSSLAYHQMQADSIPPIAPERIKLERRTSDAIAFSWTPARDRSGIQKYEIYEAKDLIASTGEPAYVANSLQPNQTYIFSVVAVDAAGNRSTKSAPLAVSTEAIVEYYSHRIKMDGLNDFYENGFSQKEKFATSTKSVQSYVTWDREYLYIGYKGPDFADRRSDRNKWIALYFGGQGGSREGVSYVNQTARLPFAAKYHIRWRFDGTFFQRMVYDDGWLESTKYSGQNWAKRDQYVELRIPRADIGNPHTISMVSFLMNEKRGTEWTWGANPEQTIRDGYRPSFTTFRIFDLKTMVAAAAQTENYQLKVKSLSANSVSVTFAVPDGADYVDLFYLDDKGQQWKVAVPRYTLGAKTSFATIKGLQPATSYYIKLKVIGGRFGGTTGNSIGGSSVIHVTTKSSNTK